MGTPADDGELDSDRMVALLAAVIKRAGKDYFTAKKVEVRTEAGQFLDAFAPELAGRLLQGRGTMEFP